MNKLVRMQKMGVCFSTGSKMIMNAGLITYFEVIIKHGHMHENKNYILVK